MSLIFKGLEISCPYCRGELFTPPQQDATLACVSCGRQFPIVLGIPDLRVFPDPYIDMESDRAKGRLLADHFADLSFAELVDYYYSVTPAVPQPHAQQYKRGLMAGVPRAKVACESWEAVAAKNGQPPAERLLEIGCGTAPLLVAAAPHYAMVAGVDVAFRWLVVAKKRLAENGLDIPLICACAEALPFPKESFDRVVADSVIEHVQDQRATLAECQRVMQPGGCLFVSTPNRHSLGPDPHAGVWAGGFMPQSWIASYVRRMGGVPPRRRLLTSPELSELITKAGFSSTQVSLPEMPPEVRENFDGPIRILIDLYRRTSSLSMGRAVLLRIGPSFLAVAKKPGSVSAHPVSPLSKPVAVA